MPFNRFRVIGALIAVVASSLSALGAESPNAPGKAEAEVTAEAQVSKAIESKPAGSPVEIARRLRRSGNSWILNEQDREKLSFAITNQWQGKVCAAPTVREVGVFGLLVEDESGAFWCSWTQLPLGTARKYQAIVTEVEKRTGVKELVAPLASENADAPVSVAASGAPASSPHSEKTGQAGDDTRKDGTVAAPK